MWPLITLVTCQWPHLQILSPSGVRTSAYALRGMDTNIQSLAPPPVGGARAAVFHRRLGQEVHIGLWLRLGSGEFSAARQEVSSGVSSGVYVEERWSDHPPLEPGSRAQVWPPGTCVPLVVLPAACCVTLERSLHSVGGWVWLWEAGEVLRWHRVAFVTDFMAVFALSRGCLSVSSWSHAMLHDSQSPLRWIQSQYPRGCYLLQVMALASYPHLHVHGCLGPCHCLCGLPRCSGAEQPERGEMGVMGQAPEIISDLGRSLPSCCLSFPTYSHGEDRPRCCLNTASVTDLTKMRFHHLSQREVPVWLRQSFLPRK